MKYRVAAYSLKGGRKFNQDRVEYAEKSNGVLLALADGLGGHAGGEIAAELAVEQSIKAFMDVRSPVITKPSSFLALTILQAHKRILTETESNFPDKQPRTTLVLCLVQDGYAYWAHVGDSRLYHIRNGMVRERTLDHSPVERLHQQGLISETDMQSHPQKSYLSNCLGGKHKPSITLGKETKLLPQDRLVLCTDGIWEAITADEIIKYSLYPDLEVGIEEMLHACEEKMGESCDNISVINFNWQDVVTNKPPLQSEGAKTVNEKAIWEGVVKEEPEGDGIATVNSATPPAGNGAKTAETAPEPDPIEQPTEQDYTRDVLEDVDKTIQDLQAYLNRNQDKKAKR